MRGSDKGDEPEALRAWKARQQAACIEPRYGDLSRHAQQAMKQSIFVEQTGQCVYCGRAIALDERNRHHIEHFRPRACYQELELAYDNLFLSCGPQQPQGNPQETCGNEKSNWFDESCHVAPTPEEACQRHFAFASDGRIRADRSPEAHRMIDVLKLNHRELIAERSSLIEQLDGDIMAGIALCELISSYLHLSAAGTRVSFANVAIAYLRNQRKAMQQA